MPRASPPPRAPALVLEDLAAEVMSASASDAAGVERLLALLDELAATPGTSSPRASETAALLRARRDDVAALAEALDRASETVAELQDALARAPAAAPPPASDAVAVGDGPVARDVETVALFGEFLTESGEGLNRVDQILMNAERDGVGQDTVNGLFRVFHTVKGTAGFLELADVVALAHETEAMLNRCREGTLELRGPVVDAVFDATTTLREVLDAVRAAVESSAAFPRRDGMPELLERIRQVSDGRAPPDRNLPEAEEGKALRARARAGQEPAGPVRLKETIKVDVERVDRLVEMIGELVVVESMVVNAPEISATSSVRVRDCLAQLAKVTRDLQDVGMHMRMVPVAGVFQKMARLVRDLARKSGKQVRLVTVGETTEVDRSVVEQIADPLVHMIRNAVDHGLETAEARVAAGKPAVGTIRLGACHQGGNVVIELSDDGHGLDRERIVAKAIERGLVATADGLSDAEIHGLIFAPGFSTAAQVSEISGRGVGMDVVKRNIEGMRGRVAISSTPGAGTSFQVVLPLTLAIIDGMLVACGDERYIIPTLSIVESIQPDRGMLVSLAQRHEMIDLRGEILPLVRLGGLFELPGAKRDPTEALVVVVEGLGRRLGLVVDEVVTQQQVVIKSLGEGIGETRFVSGAAILSDGRVGLILDVEEIAGLVQGTREFHHHAAVPAQDAAGQEISA